MIPYVEMVGVYQIPLSAILHSSAIRSCVGRVVDLQLGRGLIHQVAMFDTSTTTLDRMIDSFDRVRMGGSLPISLPPTLRKRIM